MIAMPLAHLNVRESQAPKRPAPPTPFQPLDPGILDASIPTFFVGRDRDGFWFARDAKGETGGIFLFRSSALAFARRASRPLGCATVFLSERFELDVDNQGHPLTAWLKPLVRSLTAAWTRATGRSGA